MIVFQVYSNRLIGMCHYCAEKYGFSQRSTYKSVVYNSRISWSGAINSWGKKIEMHMWETGKEIIWGSEKGREKLYRESEIRYGESKKMKHWKNCENPAHNPLCALRMFHSLQPLSNSAFSPTEIGLSAPFPCLYLPLSIAHAIFCLSSVTKAIWKGFVIPVVFHTVALRVSVKITENQKVINIFLFFLFLTVIVYSCHFTYSVNKELCQSSEAKKRGKVIAVALGKTAVWRETCTESQWNAQLLQYQVYIRNLEEGGLVKVKVSADYSQERNLLAENQIKTSKSTPGHQQQQNKSKCTKCLRSSS